MMNAATLGEEGGYAEMSLWGKSTMPHDRRNLRERRGARAEANDEYRARDAASIAPKSHIFDGARTFLHSTAKRVMTFLRAPMGDARG
jgi:hypothetical protein